MVELDLSNTVIEGATSGYSSFETEFEGESQTFQTYFETMGFSGQPPIVMIHGIGGGSSLFQYKQNVAYFAAKGYKVYAIDLLGFGRSSHPKGKYTGQNLRDQISQFIETEMDQAPIVVANGLSAAHVIRLAAETPDLISDMVLVAPTGYSSLRRPNPESRELGIFNSPLGDFVFWLLGNDNYQRFFLLDAYAGEDSLTPEVLENSDINIKAPDSQWVVFSFISGALDQDVADYWSQTEQKSLIVWGADATITPVEDLDSFIDNREDAQSLVVEGVKLLPNFDMPKLFNDEVLAFLKSE